MCPSLSSPTYTCFSWHCTLPRAKAEAVCNVEGHAVLSRKQLGAALQVVRLRRVQRVQDSLSHLEWETAHYSYSKTPLPLSELLKAEPAGKAVGGSLARGCQVSAQGRRHGKPFASTFQSEHIYALQHRNSTCFSHIRFAHVSEDTTATLFLVTKYETI